MNTDYPSYSDTDIYLFTERTREISRNPYQLFTAYIISALTDLIHSDPEDDQNPFIWGKSIAAEVYDRFYQAAVKDFIEAKENGLTVDIKGKPYTIRNASKIDEQKLLEAFQFPLYDGEYSICLMGVKNVEETKTSFTDQRKALKDDNLYLRKIIYLAYDDDNDGWDKLTDIEVAAYVWAFHMAKALRNNQNINDRYIVNWWQECRKYVDMPLKEIRATWNDRFKVAEIADSICVFSADKMREWNKDNNQESVVDEIEDEIADNYWYEQAVNKDFA